jgi:toxin ParE1/3/4
MTGYRLSPLARSDLDQIWEHIARDNPSAARAMIARIIAAMEKLVEFPGLDPERDDLAPGLRSFPVRRYPILYRPRGGAVEIARVVHGARKLPDLEGL